MKYILLFLMLFYITKYSDEYLLLVVGDVTDKSARILYIKFNY